jgi:hypothetical protein
MVYARNLLLSNIHGTEMMLQLPDLMGLTFHQDIYAYGVLAPILPFVLPSRAHVSPSNGTMS